MRVGCWGGTITVAGKRRRDKEIGGEEEEEELNYFEGQCLIRLDKTS